jgi:Transposase Tn5 dimerisation domain
MSYETDCLGYWFQELLTDFVAVSAENATNCLDSVALVRSSEDTTSLNFSALEHTEGLGPLTDSAKARGLHLHTTLALRDDGVALGILDQAYWARPPGERTAAQRKDRPIEEKESHKWLAGIEAAENALAALPPEERPRLIHVMDREGDIHEVLERVSASPHFAIIRSAQDRSVAGIGDKAFAAVDAAPVMGTCLIDVPRLSHQPDPAVAHRQATLELRAVTVTITPDPKKHPHRQPVTWTLIEAREINAPVGVEPLHWRLWSNLPATTLADLVQILHFYGFRWRIEVFHLTFKSGCQIEKLQLETADRLIKAATLYSAVAVRILTLRDLARTEPNAPCTTILTQDEWQALWVRFAKNKLTADTEPPTIKQAVPWIGRLGGHLGRKRDGMPGVRTLWRGFRDLSILAAGFHAGRSLR